MMIYISKDYIDLKTTHVIDYYSSVIWNTKYNEIGDFEICLPIIDNEMLRDINVYDIIWLSVDFRDVRIITNIKYQYSIENGYYIILTGYSFAYVLNNRVVWEQTNFNDSPTNIIYNLVLSNCISSTNTNRNLTNLIINSDFQKGDVIQAQYQGEVISDVIKNLAQQYDFGYHIFYINKKFTFELFEGADNDNITFSSSLGNLLDYTINIDGNNYKNSALVLGEGEGISRVNVEVSDTSDYSRRELYVNASELSQNKDSEIHVIDVDKYKSMLSQNGKSYLENYKTDFKFECSIYPEMYKFREDYNVGDKVKVVTDFIYNNSNTVDGIITDVVESWSDKGYECMPTIKFD